jgi:transcriptional regulator
VYRPPLFREDRVPEMQSLIRENPLGLLVSVGEEGVLANPVPMVLDAAGSPFGTLRAHLARANPQWRSFADGQEALVVFQGPDRYVTPGWYETKRATGKVVPTWNYAIVQARGPVRVVDDRDWLARHVAALTDAMEADLAEPWAVADAPAEFIAGQLKGIVGIEIAIARLEGKWKVSQNRPEPDRAGVVAGLEAEGDERSLAMARLVAAGGPAPEG